MGIFDVRHELMPFEYNEAYEFWVAQRLSYWTHFKMGFGQDVLDFKTKLTDSERHQVGTTLKGFSQVELVVGNEYWSKRICKWFPKPEIQLMGLEFAGSEANHTVSYSQIDVNVGLTDYKAFLQDPVVKAKLDRLVIKEKTIQDKALSLAIFSAFMEGVSLFSSFAVLLNFKRRGLLPAIGAIITYSVRDESLHSHAGCWLFNTVVAENPDIFTDEFKKKVYEAARLTVQLEDDYIERAYSLGPIDGLDKNDLKQFVRNRANEKLRELGLKNNWKTLDKDAVRNVDEWFSLQVGGSTSKDFFFKRPTDYSKGSKSFNDVAIKRVFNTGEGNE